MDYGDKKVFKLSLIVFGIILIPLISMISILGGMKAFLFSITVLFAFALFIAAIVCLYKSPVDVEATKFLQSYSNMWGDLWGKPMILFIVAGLLLSVTFFIHGQLNLLFPKEVPAIQSSIPIQ